MGIANIVHGCNGNDVTTVDDAVSEKERDSEFGTMKENAGKAWCCARGPPNKARARNLSSRKWPSNTTHQHDSNEDHEKVEHEER